MDNITKLQDGDGHWYWIPNNKVKDFKNDLDVISGIEYMDNPQRFDDFNEDYSHFATGGDKDIVPPHFYDLKEEVKDFGTITIRSPKDVVDKVLLNYPQADFRFVPDGFETNGDKLSIQGSTLEDSGYLFFKLYAYFSSKGIAFKSGTKLRLDSGHPIQSKKVMTVYIPKGMDYKEIAKIVNEIIPEYKGGNTVLPPPSYEHISGSIYYRNDRDSDGNYIMPINPITKLPKRIERLSEVYEKNKDLIHALPLTEDKMAEMLNSLKEMRDICVSFMKE